MRQVNQASRNKTSLRKTPNRVRQEAFRKSVASVGQIIKRLQHHDFEHQNHVKRLAACVILAFMIGRRIGGGSFPVEHEKPPSRFGNSSEPEPRTLFFGHFVFGLGAKLKKLNNLPLFLHRFLLDRSLLLDGFFLRGSFLLGSLFLLRCWTLGGLFG